MSSPKIVKETPSDSFTMVFIDCDDTLVPTTIRQTMNNNFDIDIFEYLSNKSLKKLQFAIVDAIENIKKCIEKRNGSNHRIRFSLISNATKHWLNGLFDCDDCDNPCRGDINDMDNPNSMAIHPVRFPILSEYFADNDISIHSSANETMSFLKNNYGNDKATSIMLKSTIGSNKSNRWMWKYTSMTQVISETKKQLGCECKQIISFGDGEDERTALDKYSKTFKVQSVHMHMLPAPSIHQLVKQWQFLRSEIGVLLDNVKVQPNVQNNICYVYELNEIFKSDNDRFCTGAKFQIPSITLYFYYWLNIAKNQEAEMNALVERIERKKSILRQKEQSMHFVIFKKLVQNALCNHPGFDKLVNGPIVVHVGQKMSGLNLNV